MLSLKKSFEKIKGLVNVNIYNNDIFSFILKIK
jgi:hypothetical protein